MFFFIRNKRKLQMLLISFNSRSFNWNFFNVAEQKRRMSMAPVACAQVDVDCKERGGTNEREADNGASRVAGELYKVAAKTKARNKKMSGITEQDSGPSSKQMIVIFQPFHVIRRDFIHPPDQNHSLSL